MIVIDTPAHPGKKTLYCIKNRYGTTDCAVNEPMAKTLESVMAASHAASIIYMSEDGNHLLLDFSVRK